LLIQGAKLGLARRFGMDDKNAAVSRLGATLLVVSGLATVGVVTGIYLYEPPTSSIPALEVSGPPANDGAAPSDDRTEAAPSPRRFTKQQFDAYVVMRTKAQIKDEFGPPDEVQDDTDSWVYFHLNVYDAEAGTLAGTSIRFAGIDGPGDQVVSTSYF
jgi:hypothetical protein